MAGKDLNDEIRKTLRDAHYASRQSRDNSSESSNQLESKISNIVEEFNKSVSELGEKFIESSEALSNAMREWSLQGGPDEYRHKATNEYFEKQYKSYLTLGFSEDVAKAKAKENSDIFDDKLKSEQDVIINTFNNLKNKLYKDIEDKKAERNADINDATKEYYQKNWSAVTGGRSSRFQSSIDELSSFGRGVYNLDERKEGTDGFLGKFGKSIINATNSVSRFSGGMGVALKVLEMVSETLTYASKNLKIDASQASTDLQYQSRNLYLASQRANAELDLNNQLLSKRAEVEASYIASSTEADFNKLKGAIEVLTSSFSDITTSAFKSLETEIAYKYAKQRANIDKEYALKDGGELALLQKKLDVAFKENIKVIEADREFNKIVYERSTTRNEIQKIGNNAKVATSAVGAIGGAAVTGGIGGAFVGKIIGDQIYNVVGGPMLDLYADNKDFNLQITEQAKQLNVQNRNLQKQFANSVETSVYNIEKTALETRKLVATKTVSVRENEELAWSRLAQDIDKRFEVSENAANAVAVSFGYLGEQMDLFKTNMFNSQVSVGKWGKTLEDLSKYQENFIISTGRNKNLTDKDYSTSFALGKFVGDDTVMSLASGMEIFNRTVSDSNDMFFEMYKTVLKMGLNGKRFGQDLVKNLRLAQKYDFKGGVEGLMEMSKWAQNMRFNVGSLEGMVDKVQTGGLEGVIQQSAGLQVLGGNFAMGSNPLAMAYEAYNDPEAYAKRLNNMLVGQAVLNTKTGEYNLRGTSVDIVRRYAELNGMDYLEASNQAKQLSKISDIKKTLGRNSGLDEEQIASIANKATYKNGSWVVNLGKHNERGEEVLTNIKNVTADDMRLLAVDSNKSLEDTAAESLSLQERQVGVQNTMLAILQNNFASYKSEHIERIRSVWGDFIKDGQTYMGKVSAYISGATASLNTLRKFYEDTSPDDLAKSVNQDIVRNLSVILDQIRGIAEKIGAESGLYGKSVDELGGNQLLTRLKTYVDKNGGFSNALKLVGDSSSTFYDRDMKSVMEMLRGDSSGLLKVKNNDLRVNLARLIMKWDDKGSTKDLDFQNNKALYSIYKAANGGKDISNLDGGGYINSPSTNWFLDYFGGLAKVKDGIIHQNGVSTRIDKDDQVLAAKKDGPIDKMLNNIQNISANNSTDVKSFNNSTSVSSSRYNNNNRDNHSKLFNNSSLVSSVNSISPNTFNTFNGSSINTSSNVLTNNSIEPITMPYNSSVKEVKYSTSKNTINNLSSVKLEPLQININGNIKISGSNGSIDITQQIASDPNFLRSLTQMISLEVEKKVNGGRVENLMNRNLKY